LLLVRTQKPSAVTEVNHLTDQAPLTDEDLDGLLTIADDGFCDDLDPGDLRTLVAEVRRLRALVRRTVSGIVATNGGCRDDDEYRDYGRGLCLLCGATGHETDCPWPELEAEAKRTE